MTRHNGRTPPPGAAPGPVWRHRGPAAAGSTPGSTPGALRSTLEHPGCTLTSSPAANGPVGTGEVNDSTGTRMEGVTSQYLDQGATVTSSRFTRV